LPTGYDEEGGICAYSDPIQAKVKVVEDGQLNLESMTFKAWQSIQLPRQWDDPEKRDPSPVDELRNFANRIARAMNAMEDGMAHLVKGSDT
jgi:hypothetical protein